MGGVKAYTYSGQRVGLMVPVPELLSDESTGGTQD